MKNIYPGLTLSKAPDDFDLRKAALDAAVMHHDETSNEAAVIETAAKFESYLRRGVTLTTEAGPIDGACNEPGCMVCRPGGLIDVLFPTMRDEHKPEEEQRQQQEQEQVADEPPTDPEPAEAAPR